MCRRIVVRLFAFVFLCCAASPGRAAEEAKRIAFLHVNDVYQVAAIDPRAPRGGLARLASLAAEYRRQLPATLFTLGGDTLSPSVESGLFKGRQMMAAWNAVGVDLAVLGNHEFDFGPEVLRERLAEARFPWLAANLEGMAPLATLHRSRIVELGGVKVGLVGLITPETASLSRPGPHLRFTGLLAAARREAAALRKAGAEVVVALTHCTLAEDRQLARSGIFNLILGGHDHHPVAELVGRTPIFKAGSDARDLVRVVVRLRRDAGRHRVAGIEWEIVPVDGRWPEAPAVIEANRQFESTLAAMLDERIGDSAVALDARGESMRRGETNIGNFVADAVRAATGSEVTILNGGGFRADRVIAPGTLTRRDVVALLPFENPLVVLSISGATLRAVLEHGIGRRVVAGQSGAMPHVSGLRLAYAPDGPAGARIASISVGGEALDPERRYRLATSAYLAGGGDGYALLKDLPVLRAAESAPIETEVAIEAVRAAGIIAPAIDGRLQVMP